MTVGDLLAILAITKQSAARTLSLLVEHGYLEMTSGIRDRRQRFLRLTAAGAELEQGIYDELHANVEQAYTAAGGIAVAGF